MRAPLHRYANDALTFWVNSFFDSYTPHRSGPNLTDKPRRVLYVTYNRLSEGEHRATYYADKRRSYPPDCEREPGKTYVFRV